MTQLYLVLKIRLVDHISGLRALLLKSKFTVLMGFYLT